MRNFCWVSIIYTDTWKERDWELFGRFFGNLWRKISNNYQTMKKSSSDFIFRLIQSLTKSEKRYFKIYSNRFTYKDKQKYLDLFDAIDKQKEYDEVALKKKFAGEKFLKHFPTVKTRLKDMVLEGLGDYYGNSSQKMNAYRKILISTIMHNKGFYNESVKLTKQVKNYARTEEQFGIIIEALFSEIRDATLLKDGNIEKLKTLKNEMKLQTEKLNNLITYETLKEEIYSEYNRNKGFLNSSFINQFFAQKYLKDEKYALTEKAKILYYDMYALRYHAEKNEEKSFEYLEKIIHYIESKKTRLKTHARRYRITLINCCASVFNIRNYTKLLMFVEKLELLLQESHIKKSESVSAHLESAIIGYRLTIYWYQQDINRGCKLIQGISTVKIKQFEKQLMYYQIISVYTYSSLFLFSSGNFEEALDYTTKAINIFIKEDFNEYDSLVFIINILSYFELDNLFVIEHLCISYQRYFKKWNSLNSTLNKIFIFLKKLHHSPNYSEFKKQLKGFKQNIENELDKKYISHQIMDAWLKSKIQNRPLKDILIEKYGKENRNSTL